MSQLAVAQQLRTLASDPDNQTFIVNEKECMNGLLQFLDSADNEVVIVSLQALQFLSTSPSNQATLAAYPGLLIKLTNLTDSEDRSARKVALDTLDNLQGYINREKNQEKPKKQFKPRYLHEFCVQIHNMLTLKDRNRVEGCLIAIEGVVSVTIDRASPKCTIYTNVPQADIQDSILGALRAQSFLVDGDKAAEVPSENAFKPRNLQGYLDQPGSAAEKQPSAAAQQMYMADVKPGAIMVYGSVEQSSLQARQARRKQKQKQEEEKKGAVRSLFGAVSSYFW